MPQLQRHQRLRFQLEQLRDELVLAVMCELPHLIREGTVMTSGPVPYRRLDCCGRALAYFRVRPRKRGVRIDISGIWDADFTSRLTVRTSSAQTLLVSKRSDITEAVRVLTDAVLAGVELEPER